MLLYAGIDEAGYGPMLGPLCVGMVLLQVDDADPADGAPPLWKRLEASVARSLGEARGRIVVDDSKRLKGARNARGHPLRHLERGVLGFLAAAADADAPAMPEDDAALLAALGASVPPRPWYEGRVELPVGNDRGSLRIDAAGLRRTLAAAGVGVLAMRVELVDAAELNAGVARAGSKSAVNLEAALRLVDDARRAAPGQHPRIILDRHGGRTRYRGELARAWPEARVDVVAEDPALSRYRVEDASGPATISFAQEADGRHLPVALASMIAKYVRELLMARMNRWFAGHRPGLAPTAGYVADGRRYLAEIQPVLRELSLDEDALVRRT